MLLAYLVCTIGLILVPLINGLLKQEAKVYRERFRETRLSMIQKRYPELRKLSWREIEESYSVKSLYDRIG